MKGPIEPKRELNGKRIQFQSKLAIYLVDQGFLRHVPDQYTYDQLFRDWQNLEEGTDLGEIPLGKPICPGAYLAQDGETQKVYFVEKSVKRHVVDTEVFDYYNFNKGEIRPLSTSELEELLDGPAIKLPPESAMSSQ